MSFVGCNAMCHVINFPVLHSICLRSSLVLFKNGPEYLTRETALVFISLMGFLLQHLVSRSFLVRLRYYFLLFSFFLLRLFDGDHLLLFLLLLVVMIALFYFFILFILFIFIHLFYLYIYCLFY